MAHDNHAIGALGAVGGRQATDRAGEAGGAAAAAGAGTLHSTQHGAPAQHASRDQISISQEALEDHGPTSSQRPNIGQGPQPGFGGGGVVTSGGGYQAHNTQPGLATGGVFTTRDQG